MPLAVFDNVFKRYTVGKTEVLALQGLSFELAAGDFLIFSGPSGSGKTTTLNLLGGLDSASSGRVLINDCDISSLSDRNRSEFRNRHIGFIFQEFNLLPVLSAIENVALPLELRGMSGRAARRRAAECLKLVDIQQYAHHRPAQLSGGQKQRVAIARAMVTGASMVLADEPTANLDTANALHVIEAMRFLNEKSGVTFVFSTHDERLLRFARRRIHLVDGRVDKSQPLIAGGQLPP